MEAKRDMLEIAKVMESTIPSDFDLTYGELMKLSKMDILTAISKAYYYGFAMGIESTKEKDTNNCNC